MKKSKSYQIPEVKDLMSDLGSLNDWEKKFILTISKKSFEQLSQKQMEHLYKTWSEWKWKRENRKIELDDEQRRILDENIKYYSKWELDFYNSIREMGYRFKSEKQANVINRLLSYNELSNNTQGSPGLHHPSQTSQSIKHTQVDDIRNKTIQRDPSDIEDVVIQLTNLCDIDDIPW